MDRLNIPEDVPIESKLVSRQIKSAQTQIEAQNAEIRKDVLKYDEVLNKQRTVIYDERRRVLAGEDLHDQVVNMIDDTVRAYVDGCHRRGLRRGLGPRPALDRPQAALPGRRHGRGDSRRRPARGPASTPSSSPTQLIEDAHAAYERREEELGAEVLRELERRVLLEVIDRKWREHLYEMDYLKDGVGLRAYAQRDPLVEYQREGFDMFAQMLDGVKEEAVGFLFNLEVQVEEAPPSRSPASAHAPVGLRRGTEPGRPAPPAAAALLGADDRRRGRHRWCGHGGRSPAPRPRASATAAGAAAARPAPRRPTAGRRRARPSARARRATRRARAARARSTSAATAPRRRG